MDSKDYAIVISRDGRYNFLTPEMQLLSDKWFDDVRHFDDYGTARVAFGRGVRKLWNIIRKDGTMLLPRWAIYITPFSCIVAAVREGDGEYAYVDMGGVIATKPTLEPNLFGIPFAYVDYGSEDCYIDCNGNVINQFSLNKK